jgi:diguanylate cyclase (GGDEF)-like protein
MRWAVVAALVLAFAPAPPAAAAPANERERLEAALQGVSGSDRIGPLADVVVASRQEAPERALSAGEEALALLARSPDAAAEVRVLNEMGWAHMVLGQYDEATTMAGRGRDLAERADDSPGLARALNNLGVIARSRGEPGQAIVFFEQALAIERALGRPREIAGVLSNLGVAHGFDLADYDTALHYTREALRLRESLGAPEDIALSENNLGVLHARLGDRERALEHFGRALEVRRSLGVPTRIAGTLHNLGDLALDAGDRATARTRHEEALVLRRQAGDRPGQLVSLIALAQVELDDGRLADAAQRLRDAEAIAATLEQPRERMLVALAQGRLAIRQGDWATAEARTLEALAQAEHGEALEVQRQATLQLSDVQAAAGRHREALDTFRRHKALSDRIFDEERTRRLDALDRRYEAERRELELETLRRERAEQGLQLSEERTTRLWLAGALIGLALVFGAFLVRRRELESINRRLAELTRTDQLTGLGNRRLLEDTLQADVPLSLRRRADGRRAADSDLVALLIDVDHFKAVNDQRGHAVGDRVLARFAAVLRATCRGSDVVVRWGGEEFLVLQRFVDRAQAAPLAARIAAAVRAEAFALDGEPPLGLTCSIGFAAFPIVPDADGGGDWRATLALADEALYLAKARRDAWVGVLRRIDGGPIGEREDVRSLLRAGAFELARSFDAGSTDAPGGNSAAGRLSAPGLP